MVVIYLPGQHGLQRGHPDAAGSEKNHNGEGHPASRRTCRHASLLDQSGHRASPLLQFGGMDARIAAAGFLDADGFALPVELREVVQPQAAAEPTREGIEPGVGEELQHEIPALEDHPAGVPENDSEAQPFIEGGGGIEIS